MSGVMAITAQDSGTKRFARPDELPEFSLTPRTLGLLADVARHRLIASDDLALLDGGSVQNVKRELRTLWAHGYGLNLQLLRRVEMTKEATVFWVKCGDLDGRGRNVCGCELTLYGSYIFLVVGRLFSERGR